MRRYGSRYQFPAPPTHRSSVARGTVLELSHTPSLGIEPRREIIAARKRLLKASQNEQFPYDIDVDGVKFEIHRGVFSPKWFESTEFFCQMLPYQPGLRLLDIGCGCGAVAVLAALRGAAVADGIDILAEAVKNTQVNAVRHSVASTVRAWVSDLFSDIEPRGQYDVIFWNSPWVYIDEGSELSSIEIAVLDPGYRLLERFLEQSYSRLAPNGKILLGFGNFGELAALVDLSSGSYSINELGRCVGKGPDHLEYMIYELKPLPGGRTGH